MFRRCSEEIRQGGEFQPISKGVNMKQRFLSAEGVTFEVIWQPWRAAGAAIIRPH